MPTSIFILLSLSLSRLLYPSMHTQMHIKLHTSYAITPLSLKCKEDWIALTTSANCVFDRHGLLVNSSQNIETESETGSYKQKQIKGKC